MRRRELVLLTFAMVMALSMHLERSSYAEIPPACQPPEVSGLDPGLPCTIPIEIEVEDRRVTIRWSAAEVESILGDNFGGYRVWRWRVPRGYDLRDPLDADILFPDTSSYSLLQVLARDDTTIRGCPSFSELRGEWTFIDPDSLFTFEKASSLFIGPGGVAGDSVFYFVKAPRVEAGPVNGFPYYYAVTYFASVVDTLYSVPGRPPAYVTAGLSSKMPEPAGDFAFPVFAGGRPKPNLGEVIVVPNPYSDRASWEFFGSRKLQFVNLPEGSKVDIFTAAGDFIRSLRLDGGGRGTGDVNMVDWDLRSEAGEEVTAGVYIYRVESPDGRDFIGRFAVIR